MLLVVIFEMQQKDTRVAQRFIRFKSRVLKNSIAMMNCPYKYGHKEHKVKLYLVLSSFRQFRMCVTNRLGRMVSYVLVVFVHTKQKTATKF